MASSPEFLLHTYYRSSCSARLRIALNVKGVEAEYAHVLLYKAEQYSDKHGELNPSRSVPINQSDEALPHIQEIYTHRQPLLPPPSQPLERAKVRVLVNIITNDVQPITNRRITKAVKELGADPIQWSKYYMTRGLEAYESIASKTAGKYSVGDSVTMADVCLLPAIYAAEKHEVDLEELETITRVYKVLSELEPVRRAHWSLQKDTPADMAWL